MSVYIGTSGYNYKHWRGRFYPEDLSAKDWLPYYSKYFNSVEINATFYGHFKRNVFENWSKITPRNFSFVLKGPRFITHVKRLKDAKESLNYFLDETVGLENKLSCVLWQFPPSFHKNEETLERIANFFSILPKLEYAVEVRNKSWFEDDFFTLLDKNKIGFVINDSARFPWIDKITGRLVYIRFHGPGRLYASDYSQKQLSSWATKIRDYQKNRNVFCFFNNDGFAYAIKNAKELKKLV